MKDPGNEETELVKHNVQSEGRSSSTETAEHTLGHEGRKNQLQTPVSQMTMLML